MEGESSASLQRQGASAHGQRETAKPLNVQIVLPPGLLAQNQSQRIIATLAEGKIRGKKKTKKQQQRN